MLLREIQTRVRAHFLIFLREQKQTIGNWPGVTVERVEGQCNFGDGSFNIVDLPGIYSLAPNSEDEQVTRSFLLENRADLVVNILDASNLSRNLFLTLQLIEMRIPVVVVLNMMDIAKNNGLEIDIDHLSEHLKCPVIGVSAVNNRDADRLKSFIAENVVEPALSSVKIRYPNEIEDVISKWQPGIERLADELGYDARWMTIRLLEDDESLRQIVADKNVLGQAEIEETLVGVENVLNETTDTTIADYVYGAVVGLTKDVVKKVRKVKPVGDLIDSFVMHPILGIPIFFAVMLLVFAFTIQIGNVFVGWFDAVGGIVFVDGFRSLLEYFRLPELLIFLLSDGIGAGIQMVFSFIPFVSFMFLMLSLLEDSGYMARAAFVMDGFMGKIGLPGKAFVSMIVGFGCTVPAILATRTLDNRRDRILTVFMLPLMSCGARLPVYALFATAFFPKKTGLIVFSLYMVGIAVAVISGLLIKSTILRGEPSQLIMELPRYHVPRVKHIVLHTWAKLRDFLGKAGKVMIIAVFILSVFSSLSFSGGFNPDNVSGSILANLGKFITPIFTPMGIEGDNWPATVGLFTGLFAKEAVIGTLNAIYSQLSHGAVAGGISSLRENFSRASAYAYLLFVLLYMPCVAALGTVMKEIGTRFGLLQALYLTVVAWIVSTLFYQIVEGHNILFILLAVGIAIAVFLVFKLSARSKNATTLK